MLRCAECRGTLALAADRLETIERPPSSLPPCSGLCEQPVIGAPCDRCRQLDVVTGALRCRSCQRPYRIAEGIPWMAPGPAIDDEAKRRTEASFGHLWARSNPVADAPLNDYHFEKMAATLGFTPPTGLVLDAGCGDGIDLSQRARSGGDLEVVGAELSAGGCGTTARRIRGLANAHVVQADLARLPFADGTFDFAYSYGVLHHMPVPDAGMRDMARVAKPGAAIAIYLYEDFSDRSLAWRAALAIANWPRAVTTRLPHRLLYTLCQMGSPVVFMTLTLPHRLLRRFAASRAFANLLPFRHGKGPFSMTGDLYDRFSAPVEFRYSQAGTRAFVERAGLAPQKIAKERGWMALAVRPR
jgi:SAM-dependent methyltransferase